MNKTPFNISDIRWLLILSGISLFAQLAYFITFNAANGMLSLITYWVRTQDTHFQGILLPFLSYLTCEMMINIIFIWLIWYSALSIVNLFSLDKRFISPLCGFLWLLAMLAVLIANHVYFSGSIFSGLMDNLTGSLLTDNFINHAFTATLLGLFAWAVLVMLNIGISVVHKQNLRQHGIGLALTVSVLAVYGSYYYAEKPGSAAPTPPNKPNVIIIGLDALRPDFTSMEGNPYVHTPTIDHYLQSSINFTEAYTPLARTNPAWVSILTGTYPKTNHARNNMLNPAEINLDETLAKRLRDQGYETLYASDDRMFNTVDKRYGFDNLITPRTGAAMVLINIINDFPLSNIVMATPLGEYLFPYNYANHNIGFTYDPKDFLHLISGQLRHRSGKPLFLSVHFNLSGSPLNFSALNIANANTDYDSYKQTTKAVDRQLGGFFEILSRNKLLSHTIVVLLSDHGIGLGLPGDRVTAENLYQGDKNNIKLYRVPYNVPVMQNGVLIKQGIDSSTGYGSDILSGAAYHVMLAFKGYGVDIGKPRKLSGHTSLIDIAPTLLDLLQLSPLSRSDGISLKPYFLDSSIHINPARELFMETCLTLPSMQEKRVSPQKVVKEGVNLFHFDRKSGQLVMNQGAEEAVNKSRQKAVLLGNWLLADMPEVLRYKRQGNNFTPYMAAPQLILVNTKTGAWTTEMNTAFAQSAPLEQLLAKLNRFYGDELAAYHA